MKKICYLVVFSFLMILTTSSVKARDLEMRGFKGMPKPTVIAFLDKMVPSETISAADSMRSDEFRHINDISRTARQIASVKQENSSNSVIKMITKNFNKYLKKEGDDLHQGFKEEIFDYNVLNPFASSSSDRQPIKKAKMIKTTSKIKTAQSKKIVQNKTAQKGPKPIEVKFDPFKPRVKFNQIVAGINGSAEYNTSENNANLHLNKPNIISGINANANYNLKGQTVSCGFDTSLDKNTTLGLNTQQNFSGTYNQTIALGINFSF